MRYVIAAIAILASSTLSCARGDAPYILDPSMQLGSTVGRQSGHLLCRQPQLAIDRTSVGRSPVTNGRLVSASQQTSALETAYADIAKASLEGTTRVTTVVVLEQGNVESKAADELHALWSAQSSGCKAQVLSALRGEDDEVATVLSLYRGNIKIKFLLRKLTGARAVFRPLSPKEQAGEVAKLEVALSSELENDIDLVLRDTALALQLKRLHVTAE
jgi:hypothetical protein